MLLKEVRMKGIVVIVFACMIAANVLAGEITVYKVQGDVSVRHGVGEVWTKVSVGDALKPEDTMKTGRRGSAVLVASGDASTTKKIALPGEVIVDMSDVRELSQEELMLKLTMERVRSSSYEWKNEELNIPNAAVVHGDPPAQNPTLSENSIEVGTLQLNGTRVLYENGFYSTSALKAMDVLRRYPSLAEEFEHRFMIAQALEKANLRGEALNEYVSLSSSENLKAGQRTLLQTKISQLRRELER